MKLYIDCTSGVSSDMILTALVRLGGETDEAKKLNLPHDHEDHQKDHQKDHHGHSHRSHREIKELVEHSELKESVKKTILSIYQVIATAEAKVHGTTVDDVHFHEVGRAGAIENIAGIAAALDSLAPEEIYCSDIHDGKGWISCSHGLISVPVPAVMAMRDRCDYVFVTEDIETEMVTPSGLGILIGIDARHIKEQPQGEVAASAVAKGGRDTGKEGLRAVLIH